MFKITLKKWIALFCFLLLIQTEMILSFGIAKPKTQEKIIHKPKPIEAETAEETFFAVPDNLYPNSQNNRNLNLNQTPIDKPSKIDSYEFSAKDKIDFSDHLNIDLHKEVIRLKSENETALKNKEANLHLSTETIQQDDYKLKIGDTLLISMYGDEKTKRHVTVDPSGKISYLYAETITASGKTIPQLRKEIEQKLKNYFRFVTLSITPLKFNGEFYTISGQVKESGKQPFIGRPTILTALCKAQGFPLIDYRDQMWDMCDLEKAFIAREGNYIPIDFARLVKEGDLHQNIFLEPGDFIYIPNRMIKQVFVLGEVAAPKAVDYFDDMSLLEAITDAGDTTDRASTRLVVLRGSLASPIHFLIDYNKIVKGHYPDFRLQSGDIVYVPPRKLYLLREIFRAAVASFVYTVAYETGIEWFIRSHPSARPFLQGGTILPTPTPVPVPIQVPTSP